jgi:hypothetical protein
MSKSSKSTDARGQRVACRHLHSDCYLIVSKMAAEACGRAHMAAGTGDRPAFLWLHNTYRIHRYMAFNIWLLVARPWTSGHWNQEFRSSPGTCLSACFCVVFSCDDSRTGKRA